MDAPQRGALMLVRFTAAALMGVSAVEMGLYWVESSVRQTPVRTFHCVLLAVPSALGIVGLIADKSIAQWISDKFE
jgi:hypothetical protein